MAGENFLQRELSRILVKYRKKAGLTKDQAVWFLGTSENILNSYESGKLQYMEPGIIESWLRDYGAPQDVIDDAKAKAKWIRQGNPANWAEAAPAGFARFTQIEPLAKSICIHEDAFVTGLCQTVSYAEAVLRLNPNLVEEQRRDALGFRMQRKETVLRRPGGPPEMQVVLPEAGLTRFGQGEIFEDQVDHLAELNRVEGIEIFIMPKERTNPSWGRSYRIMSFPDEKDPEVVYQEHLFGALYEAGKAYVAQCRRLLSATLPVALGFEEWREISCLQVSGRNPRAAAAKVATASKPAGRSPLAAATLAATALRSVGMLAWFRSAIPNSAKPPRSSMLRPPTGWVSLPPSRS